MMIRIHLEAVELGDEGDEGYKLFLTATSVIPNEVVYSDEQDFQRPTTLEDEGRMEDRAVQILLQRFPNATFDRVQGDEED